MAVSATPIESVLVVEYEIGLDEGGSPIIRRKSIQNVRSSAGDQEVYDVAEALFNLQQYPMTGVRRDNRVDLANA